MNTNIFKIVTIVLLGLYCGCWMISGIGWSNETEDVCSTVNRYANSAKNVDEANEAKWIEENVPVLIQECGGIDNVVKGICDCRPINYGVIRIGGAACWKAKQLIQENGDLNTVHEMIKMSTAVALVMRNVGGHAETGVYLKIGIRNIDIYMQAREHYATTDKVSDICRWEEWNNITTSICEDIYSKYYVELQSLRKQITAVVKKTDDREQLNEMRECIAYIDGIITVCKDGISKTQAASAEKIRDSERRSYLYINGEYWRQYDKIVTILANAIQLYHAKEEMVRDCAERKSKESVR